MDDDDDDDDRWTIMMMRRTMRDERWLFGEQLTSQSDARSC